MKSAVYNVYVEATAERDLRRLPTQIRDRIVPVIVGLAPAPRPHGCRKIAGSQNDWRIRVGDHRVVYEIDDTNKTVKVMRVRHRREAYR